MRRLGRHNDLHPAKVVLVLFLRDRTRVFQGGNDVRPFFLCQEARRFGRARENEKGDHTKYKGKYAFLSKETDVLRFTTQSVYNVPE